MRGALLLAGASLPLLGAIGACESYSILGDDPAWLSQQCPDGSGGCFNRSPATGGSGGTASSTGGSPACNTPDKCPVMECQAATCESAACKYTDLSQGACRDGKGVCNAGACELSTGQSCTEGDTCQSGHCESGVCCANACGVCEACSADGATCVHVKEGDPGKGCGESSGGCSATPGLCRCEDGAKNGDETDVDCGGGKCAKCGMGSACQVNTDCTSTFCVDGRCCKDDCSTTCHTCGDLTQPGLCVPVSSEAADPMCTADHACSPQGKCASANNEDCDVGSPDTCASGHCPNGKCQSCLLDSDCSSDERCVDFGTLRACVPK